jgi:DNA-binding NarL/FixJ family response regulator
VRVAIVEDDRVLRDALAGILSASAQFTVIGAVGTLREARLLACEGPEVFLIDLGLPDGSGLELISELRASGECKPLVLSVFGDGCHVVRAIEAGAAGYLLKGADLTQTSAAIQTVLAGGAPLTPAVASHILDRVRNTAPAPPRPSQPSAPPVSLTPREVTLLECLARGLTLKEAAAIHGISHHTVGDHVKSIYRKLAVNSRGEAIFEAAQTGLIRLHD